MEYVLNKNGRGILLSMVRAIQENKAYLGEIDGLIGDGDHGMNMNKGFSVYAETLGENETSVSDGLYDLGTNLLNKIGGSMGPIYGTILLHMSEQAEDVERIDLPQFIKMLESGMEGLYEIVDARPGDKTLVDTLYPALAALKAAEGAGKSFTVALEDMKTAAETGKESTRNLAAKYGRSARLGERSRGFLDAGAVSCCIILKAMASSMQKQMEDEDVPDSDWL